MGKKTGRKETNDLNNSIKLKKYIYDFIIYTTTPINSKWITIINAL